MLLLLLVVVVVVVAAAAAAAAVRMVPTCKDGAVAWPGAKNAELSEGGAGLQDAGGIDWQRFIRMRRQWR